VASFQIQVRNITAQVKLLNDGTEKEGKTWLDTTTVMQKSMNDGD